jgi:hypothetical protein
MQKCAAVVAQLTIISFREYREIQMNFVERLREFIAAAFSGIWIESHEHDEAIRKIRALCRDQKWSMATWDIDKGLSSGTVAVATASDPLAALRAVSAFPVSPDSSMLLILPNYHRFLGSPEIAQCLLNALQVGKSRRTFIVILSAVLQIPIELERQFVVLHHHFPDREQLREIAEGIKVAGDGSETSILPSGDDLDRLLDASVGLTCAEAENAFSLSLVRHGRLLPETVWDLKTQGLKKSGLLTLHRGDESFDDLGGLAALKSFCIRAATSKTTVARPRGILLLGVAGSGKSAFCKALGNQISRPTLILDIGALMGSLVGQTESNIRRALAIADAMAPCVLMIDEVEKGLSGVAASGQTDSGVSARLFGTFLTWLNDHTSDVFVVCTSNDISKLPPEFSRAERFDGVFFCDLPSTAEKAGIWELYLKTYKLPQQELPRAENWTGAEIRSCCRLTALLGTTLIEAATQVVPVAATAAESVERLRNWASGRCLSASTPGLYQLVGATTNHTTGRRVAKSSTN